VVLVGRAVGTGDMVGGGAMVTLFVGDVSGGGVSGVGEMTT
jgi:hypothetical protein